jgi:hypothetical protein
MGRRLSLKKKSKKKLKLKTFKKFYGGSAKGWNLVREKLVPSLYTKNKLLTPAQATTIEQVIPPLQVLLPTSSMIPNIWLIIKKTMKETQSECLRDGKVFNYTTEEMNDVISTNFNFAGGILPTEENGNFSSVYIYYNKQERNQSDIDDAIKQLEDQKKRLLADIQTQLEVDTHLQDSKVNFKDKIGKIKDTKQSLCQNMCYVYLDHLLTTIQNFNDSHNVFYVYNHPTDGHQNGRQHIFLYLTTKKEETVETDINTRDGFFIDPWMDTFKKISPGITLTLQTLQTLQQSEFYIFPTEKIGSDKKGPYLNRLIIPEKITNFVFKKIDINDDSTFEFI